MSYIGNNLQTAFPSYLNIDDISGSFDGVTTSFPLTVGGVAPVPAPLSSNQCLISVGGVVQRPDDSGTEGFLLSGGNIVFSAAPAALDDFFGVILAGADYVNVGVNFPSGTATTPSITFDTDLDTGIYNPGANEIGFTTAGVNRVTINSSGNVSIVNDLTVDTNTLHVDSTNNRVGIGTTSPDEKLEVVGNIKLSETSTTLIFEDSDSTNLTINRFQSYDGALIADVDPSNNGSSASSFRVNVDGSERARIDNSGRLLVGTSTARATRLSTTSITPTVQTLDGGSGGFFVYNNVAGANPATIYAAKSRGNDYTSAVQNGDSLFRISAAGADGTQATEAVRITAEVDGTPGANDMPGRLVFSTTADGDSSPTERMRIDSAGLITTAGSFKDPAITGTILEDIYTITDGAAFEVDPGNGSVQLITLGANRTPKATNFAAGEAVTLMIDDGSAYTLTWTDATWGTSGVAWTGGSAPTLATTGYTVVQFWKVGTQVYGAYVGDAA